MTPMTSINRAAPTPNRPAGSRRTGLLAAGVLVLVAGLIAGAVLWLAAGRRNDDAIRGLARAAVGCDTTLNFAEPGTYLVFVETRGTLDDVDGTCPQTGDFATTGDVPALRVFFVDDDGADLGIELPRRTDVEYSGAGAEGRSLRSFTIDTAGDYTLRVQSPGDGVAIAVGRDPSDGVSLLQNLAAASVILGLIAGGLLLVFGARRSDMTLAPQSTPWPTMVPPTSPPGIRPPGNPIPPGWQPVAGPPTTLRPPDRSSPPATGWAAPTPSSPPRPVRWTAPDVEADGGSTAPDPERPGWAPRPPPTGERAAGDDDSRWAPPSD